jgi:hypothetical protein
MDVRYLLILLVTLSGCVRAGFDGQTSRDLWSPDGTPGDVVSADRSIIDGAGPVDQAAADGGDPQKTPAQIAACQGPCASGDCDGLPDYRDPEPQDCNELLFEETFGNPPTAWSTTGGSWSWKQGWYEQSAVDQSAWLRAQSASLTETDYLVEARFKLGAQSTSDSWRVAVVGRFVHQDRYFYGGITVEPNYPYPIPDPDLLIRVRRDARPEIYKDPANSGYSEGYPSNVVPGYTPPTFDAGAGREYYLQLHHTENPKDMVVCRLYDETSTQRTGIFAFYDYPTYKVLLPTEPGSVGFHTRNRAAAVDYIRVFRLHRTAPAGGG